MSETVERNNRFYEQSNGEILTENEQLKEWLKIANKNNGKLQIERDMYKDSFETMSENYFRLYFRLENIIKEAREHLQETINRWEDYEQFYEVVEEDKYILEILDKGE